MRAFNFNAEEDEVARLVSDEGAGLVGAMRGGEAAIFSE